MSIPLEHVTGSANSHKLLLYALSTCGWCRKTRQLLEEMGVEYDFVYVDKLDHDQQDAAIAELKKWNESKTFPTLVIDSKVAIVGYEADRIKRTLSA